MPTATLNGIGVYFERAGDGPRLLFLNGSGATLASSELLINAFRRRFDVVAHDQRGLGRTEVPPGPYSMADYAADALALLDHVGWPSCRVVGVSFGGMVAGGRYDGIAPPENSEAIADRVPGAELRLYDGGHAFFAQDRRALPEIMEFLSG